MNVRKIEYHHLENSDCGAFLGDTQMEYIDNRRNAISQLTGKESLMTSEEVHFLVKALWRRKETVYYIIKTENGKELKATGQQSILTGNGWKRIKNLQTGDQMMCYDFFQGRQYQKLTSIEKVVGEDIFVYNISLGDRTIVANGFICSDYDMQQGDKGEKGFR